MSFLFPLYLLGVAAVAIPVILHLRRRPPRDRTNFSSLMFLEASPLERKRRRNLENLLVLLLRCALICLLAFLFARPLLRGPYLAGAGGEGRFVVALLDRSASMQREDLWERAVAGARKAAEELRESDRFALVAFDTEAELLLGFDDWAEESAARRKALVEERLAAIEAGWGATDLGSAIAFAGEIVEEARNMAASEEEDGARAGEASAGEIHLFSDLQEGADRRALEAAGWPAKTVLSVEVIAPREEGNASLHLLVSENVIALREEEGEVAALEGEAGDEEEGSLRLRIDNEAISLARDFSVAWSGREDTAVEYQVPPGNQRTFRRDVPEGGAVLELRGDAHDFDNRVYVAPEAPRPLRVIYLDGGEEDEAGTASPFFYLERAVQATNLHAPLVQRAVPEGRALAEAADFVVIAGAVEDGTVSEARRFLEGGGTVLLLLRSAEQGAVLGALAGVELALTEASLEGGYALLEGIRFEDPLLGAFADPRVRDFSKVRFWHYRALEGDASWPDAARVLARFDSGDAAWLSLPVGEGSLVVFTSGWHPSDSQLGLSTKFVPLLYSIVESGGEEARGAGRYKVGDALPVAKGSLVTRPDGVEERAGASGFYRGANLPGIYRALEGGHERVFAVNLDHRESRTESIALERLEEAGVVVKGRVAAADPGASSEVEQERTRYMLDADRERRQQFWRWLIFGAIVVVFLEMLMTGRKAQPRSSEAV